MAIKSLYVKSPYDKNPQPEEAICEYIKNLISNRVLFPGSRILQETVAQETGYSRTPIRSAFLRLEHDGLINFQPKLGATVIKPTTHEIKETYECRLLIESEVIQIACDNMNETCMEKLEECLEIEKEHYCTFNAQGFLENNRKFHMLLFMVVKNAYYEKFLNELYNKCDIYNLFYDKFRRTTADESPTVRDHRRIIEGLKTRDKTECVAALRHHINTTMRGLDMDGNERYYL